MEIILQHDSMQCGIACLKMICQNFGKEVSFSFLSNMCGCTNEGTSLLSISETAKKIGLTPICYKLSLSDLSEVQTPCILYWNQNHFVVLYKVKKSKKFYVADPGKGLVKYNLKEFKSHWISTRSNGEEPVLKFPVNIPKTEGTPIERILGTST